MTEAGKVQAALSVFVYLKRKGGLMMEQWFTIIQEISFPIFISFYLLYRIETKLEAIHTALIELK